MNRGMKKWAPFKSLNEQSDYINKMHYERNKISKPHISSDVAEEINDILINYHQQELKISYFDDGYVYDITSPIYKIDTINRRIYLNRTNYIDFVNLLGLENI